MLNTECLITTRFADLDEGSNYVTKALNRHTITPDAQIAYFAHLSNLYSQTQIAFFSYYNPRRGLAQPLSGEEDL